MSLIYNSKKWNINAEMGFIEVDINFFIDLVIIDQSNQTIQDDFNLVKIETNEGKFIIETKDWMEIQSELRSIKLDIIFDK